MKLSVIIVNFNVKYFLEQALLSVRRASNGIAMEVFVVDNHSVDDSVAMVQEKFSEVTLIANEENVGFSKANNQAIRISKGEYVLLLNPDTVVEEDTFSKCLAFMDTHPDAGALGVKMIDGSGKFLPESKRGFPDPFVAFAKTFGLSRLFPKSRLLNRYHLGYLDKDQTHEVDVLAGAFMLIRKEALDKAGLLDEDFFMYGEDIDLSYRISKCGYKNYYFAGTTIIHYKGESTKKGSLNYVRTFYQAMIIFARKHFQGGQARAFIFMLQGAIYFRAVLTIVSNIVRALFLPFLDAVLIFCGLYLLKDFWAVHFFHDPNYYKPHFLYFNVPLYTGIWLSSVYFSGGYDPGSSIPRLVRGMIIGTVLLAAVYGFLDLVFRSSRALILLGAVWSVSSMTGLRLLLHFIRYRNFDIGSERVKQFVIVGSGEESERVRHLLHFAGVNMNFIGTVAPGEIFDPKFFLNSIQRLDEIVHIYKIDEIIFCSRDVGPGEIMQWMTRLGPEIEYKIVPEESLSIIGSSSKNTPGELYTIDIRFNIASPVQRRNKRMLDIGLSIFFVMALPVIIFFEKRPLYFIRNIGRVIFGRRSWVGYTPVAEQSVVLPSLRKGILSPIHALRFRQLNLPTVQRLNFLYAKDYDTGRDLEIVWKGRKDLGND